MIQAHSQWRPFADGGARKEPYPHAKRLVMAKPSTGVWTFELLSAPEALQAPQPGAGGNRNAESGERKDSAPEARTWRSHQRISSRGLSAATPPVLVRGMGSIPKGSQSRASVIPSGSDFFVLSLYPDRIKFSQKTSTPQGAPAGSRSYVHRSEERGNKSQRRAPCCDPVGIGCAL